MSKPRDVISALLSQGLISKEDANRYLENYEYFEKQRRKIEHDYLGKWVASVNRHIHIADDLSALRELIHDEPDWNRAYVEHVGINT